MGTVYGTDYISKLPIFPGEDVVVILLRKQNYERNPFPCCCYIGDMYVPLGIPIYGKYGEGINITDIENSDDVIEYIKNIVFKTDENMNKTVTTTEKLEELLVDINILQATDRRPTVIRASNIPPLLQKYRFRGKLSPYTNLEALPWNILWQIMILRWWARAMPASRPPWRRRVWA